MKWVERIAVFLIILVPLVITAFLPLRPEALLFFAARQRAESALENGEYPIAAADLSQELSISPWRSDLWEKLGHTQYELRQYEKAITAFQKALQGKELSVDSIIELGQSYLQVNRKGDAQDLWRQESEAAGVSTESLKKIAHSQRTIGDTFGAVATLLQAYRQSPEDAELNYLIGIHLAVTQPDSAGKFLGVAAASDLYLKKTSAELIAILQSQEISEVGKYLQIGQVLSNSGEWDMAVMAFDAVVRQDPQNPLGWALLGEAHQHTGEDGEAELKKALELDPNLDMANALMALYYRRQNQPDKALVYLERAAESNPEKGIWESEIGNTMADMGDLDSAVDHLKKATEIAPDDPVVWQAFATFSFAHNLNVDSTGIPAARKALALDPGNPLLLDLMGTGLMISGDLDTAEDYLLRAIEVNAYEASYHLHLGQLFIQKKDCKNAADQLRLAADLSTEARIASNAQRLLSEYCFGY